MIIKPPFKLSYILLFIFHFCFLLRSEEDVTRTMYTAFYDDSNTMTTADTTLNKVDTVCDSMIKALSDIDSNQ